MPIDVTTASGRYRVAIVRQETLVRPGFLKLVGIVSCGNHDQ